MLTRISGKLSRVLTEEVRLQVGDLEYQVLVPEFVRRRLQTDLGSEITLHTSHYFEGNPMQGRMVPRLIGFLNEAELEFFELFCTVDKVGVRKAIKALVRPVREIADAIQRQDAKVLTTLPGVGPSGADKIIAALRRKVAKFALIKADEGDESDSVTVADPVAEDAYQALLAVGHSPVEARKLVEKALASGKKYEEFQDIMQVIYDSTRD